MEFRENSVILPNAHAYCVILGMVIFVYSDASVPFIPAFNNLLRLFVNY